jgi:polyhydroxybutyrate depolymerase
MRTAQAIRRGLTLLVACGLVGACAATPGASATSSPPASVIPAPASATQAPSPSAPRQSAASAQPSLAAPKGSSGCSSDATPVPNEMSVQVGNQMRTALVHVPPSAAVQPRPLILVFHGYGDSAEAMGHLTLMSVKADDSGFIAVYPRGIGNPSKWDVDGTSDTKFVDALLTRLEQGLCFDTRRVYATGVSMGGGMANIVGCRLAARIAAIAPVSGVYGPNWGDPCKPSRPVPVVAFHGLIDPIVPYRGGPIVDPEHRSKDLPPVIGVEAWAANWAKSDGCIGGSAQQPSIGEVEPLFWQGCAAPVELYRITLGGHAWPGSPNDDPQMTTHDLSANDVIWDFVARFALPGS